MKQLNETVSKKGLKRNSIGLIPRFRPGLRFAVPRRAAQLAELLAVADGTADADYVHRSEIGEASEASAGIKGRKLGGSSSCKKVLH